MSSTRIFTGSRAGYGRAWARTATASASPCENLGLLRLGQLLCLERSYLPGAEPDVADNDKHGGVVASNHPVAILVVDGLEGAVLQLLADKGFELARSDKQRKQGPAFRGRLLQAFRRAAALAEDGIGESTDPKENPAKSSARSWLENAKGLLLFLGIIAGILFFTRIIVRIVLTIWNVIAGFFGGIAAGVLDALDHIDLATWYFGQGQAQIRRTVYECFGNPDTVDDCKWWNIGAENGVYLWNQLMAHQSARIIFGFVFPAIILTLIKKIVDEIWEATKKPAPKD